MRSRAQGPGTTGWPSASRPAINAPRSRRRHPAPFSFPLCHSTRHTPLGYINSTLFTPSLLLLYSRTPHCILLTHPPPTAA
ncbi:hypothetical protein E2C01_078200 [Portunus trituberculatus]|uniref:Uncharacterized protein n=1 Tax=Portunus trituberculatus TaxID=210409 RepID=A0A5B7IS31_PORTR|nr:hypothetical protein [Portunus trituberculatus]